MSLVKALIVAAIASISAGAAMAAEGSVFGGPVGGTDIRNAYLPPVPGLYFGVANVPGYANSITGNNSNKSSTISRVNLVYDIQALAVTYVYPVKPFGGTLATTVQGSYNDYERFSLNNRTQRISGWGDLYADLVKYSKFLGEAAPPSPGAASLPYGLTLEGSFSMIFPIGTYNTHQISTPGHNDYFIIPNAAATYLTKPNFIGDGLEFSGHMFYDHAFRNDATNYSSGDVVDIDLAVSERSGRLQYGISGYIAFQVGRDVRNEVAVPPNGRYYSSSKIGPIVAYDFPSIGASLKVKVGLPIYSRNSIKGPQGVVALGIKF